MPGTSQPSRGSSLHVPTTRSSNICTRATPGNRHTLIASVPGTAYVALAPPTHRRPLVDNSTVSWASACRLPMRCGACRQREQAEMAEMLHAACLRTRVSLRSLLTQECSSAASLSRVCHATLNGRPWWASRHWSDTMIRYPSLTCVTASRKHQTPCSSTMGSATDDKVD